LEAALATYEKALGTRIALITSRGRGLRLRVQEGVVVLSLPRGVLSESAVKFVHHELPWIRKHLDKFQVQKQKSTDQFRFAFQDDDLIPLWFQPHGIRHVEPAQAIAESGALFSIDNHQRITIASRNSAERLLHAKKILWNGLHQVFSETVMKDVRLVSERLKVMPRKVVLKPMRTRWGSLGGNNAMHINTALMFAPRECLYYVVAHEMAHVIERNHSSRFWAQVEVACPDFSEHHRWMQKHHDYLMQMSDQVFA
jgi:predicted metal-dependent hydrolase